MDIFLRLAFLPLVVAAAYRYLASARQQLPWYDLRSVGSIELAIYGLCLGLAALWFWHVRLRQRCPQCRSVSPHFIGEKEIERFVGTKQVNGRDGEGRTTVHHVSTTFARLEYHYVCSNAECTFRWHNVRKREVT